MLEDWDLNRSVMPFDVLGSTCVTLIETILFLCMEVCSEVYSEPANDRSMFSL